MRLVYIDESGDTIPLSQNGSRYFVLTACIIDESDRKNIEDSLRLLKNEYYANPDIEIKSNFLRYANPDIPNHDSPLKLHSRDKYNTFEKHITSFLQDIPVCLISIVIDKEYFWNKYPSQNPYNEAYLALLEKIQVELRRVENFGIVIIDPRDGRVEKQIIGDELEKLHHHMRFSKDTSLYINTPNIIERLLYADSSTTIGIQICDLYCYPIFHVFEYDKDPHDYWRFQDISYRKLKSHDGRVQEYGLKIISDKTKKGL